MQINKRLYIVVLLLCLGTTMHTMAQQQDKVSAKVDLDPVVITGTSTSQRLHKTIAPVKVISAQEIKNSGFSHTQEALKGAQGKWRFVGQYRLATHQYGKYPAHRSIEWRGFFALWFRCYWWCYQYYYQNVRQKIQFARQYAIRHLW